MTSLVTVAPTYLEQLRAEMGYTPPAHAHTPTWRVEEADERFRWLMDGDRGVALLDAEQDNFELRVADPWSACPLAVIPRHYHIYCYEGLRVTTQWWLRGWRSPKVAGTLCWDVRDQAVYFENQEQWADGSHGTHSGRLYYDAAWGGYVTEMTADLTARYLITDQEFSNIIPPHIGDTRPGREKYQQAVWLDSDGILRGLRKNPLWFVSVGAQDAYGRRSIPAGGFLSWVAEPDFNPAVEILESNRPVGATTCDNLMDEHFVINVPDARHCPDGWFRLHVKYRILSLPASLATALAERTTPLEYGPMLAWKFQYAPTNGPIGTDLNRVELPGRLSYGTADFTTPVPWDEPFFGQIWTASSSPDADLYYDPQIGHHGTRSLRIAVQGEEKKFAPGSGPTVHTVAGTRYRVGAWVRTEGQVRAWVEGNEILFSNYPPVEAHATPMVEPDSDWTWVETCYVARGEEAPFVGLFVCAEGDGLAWFDEFTFVAVDTEHGQTPTDTD